MYCRFLDLMQAESGHHRILNLLTLPLLVSRLNDLGFRWLGLGDTGEEETVLAQAQDLHIYFEDLAAERLDVMDKDKRTLRHINRPLVQEEFLYIKLTIRKTRRTNPCELGENG